MSSPGSPGDLGELVVGAGEADLQTFNLAEPPFAFGLTDPGDQVVADLGDARPLGRVGPEHWAADAGVFVDAGGRERSTAEAGGDLAAFEVAEELIPLLIGGGAVLLGGPQRTTSGEERPVCLDDLVGVDGLAAQCHVDVAVVNDHLGDVWRQPGQDRVGDEEPAEVVGVAQRLPGRVAQTSVGRAALSMLRMVPGLIRRVSVPTRRWNSSAPAAATRARWCRRRR